MDSHFARVGRDLRCLTLKHQVFSARGQSQTNATRTQRCCDKRRFSETNYIQQKHPTLCVVLPPKSSHLALTEEDKVVMDMTDCNSPKEVEPSRCMASVITIGASGQRSSSLERWPSTHLSVSNYWFHKAMKSHKTKCHMRCVWVRKETTGSSEFPRKCWRSRGSFGSRLHSAADN